MKRLINWIFEDIECPRWLLLGLSLSCLLGVWI